jgi:hypothetical protein
MKANISKENKPDTHKRQLDYCKSLKIKPNESMIKQDRKDSALKETISLSRRSVSPIMRTTKPLTVSIAQPKSILKKKNIDNLKEQKQVENKVKPVTDDLQDCYRLMREGNVVWEERFEELCAKYVEISDGVGVPCSKNEEGDKLIFSELFWILFIENKRGHISFSELIQVFNNSFNFITDDASNIKAFYLKTIRDYDRGLYKAYLEENRLAYTEESQIFLNKFIYSLLDNYAEFFIASKMKKQKRGIPEPYEAEAFTVNFEGTAKINDIVYTEGFTVENLKDDNPNCPGYVISSLDKIAINSSNNIRSKSAYPTTNPFLVDTVHWFNYPKQKKELIVNKEDIRFELISRETNESEVAKEELNDSVFETRANVIKPDTERKLNQSSKSVRRRISEVDIKYPYDIVESSEIVSKVLNDLDNN